MSIQRALISVSDKTGIVAFARALHDRRIEILSTGGTAKLLAENGIPVTGVAEHTGFPEIMDGRVKTLHPIIAGGLLGRRDKDAEVMAEHGIAAIDLLVVNLYPFEETINRADCDLALAIENIDIGGPSMLRAAAKNFRDVTVLVDSADYSRVLDEMGENQGATRAATRQALACKVFEHTARYDGLVANYLGSLDASGERQEFARTLNLQFHKVGEMRYGENPHQRAAFYREHTLGEASVAGAEQIQGKALSYNNVADTDAALQCVKSFSAPACVIVKHANPCGVAVAGNLLEAYQRAFQTDPTSAFGGIIAFNGTLDAPTARTIIERQFVEVIIAPRIDPQARAVVAEKKNVRLLECAAWASQQAPARDYKRVTGGLLVQDRDDGVITRQDLKVVTRREPTASEFEDLLFAWKVAKFVKSNAIVYVREGMTIGVGAGQMSRVYSARIAAIKAQDEDLQVAGSVLASDAFFPFRDGIDAAADVGISAVIEPGGSMRDEEVIAAADEHGMAMVFTGMRHFRH